jgi:8-oxo-dGTP pyrophosphatase MutT (NUDIX family)
MIEAGETPYEAIQRELQEEIGMMPDIAKLNPIDVYQSRNGEFMYYSFVAVVDSEFAPQLNSESAGYAWVDIGVWPKPLHEGTRITLTRNRGTEKLHTILGVNRK